MRGLACKATDGGLFFVQRPASLGFFATPSLFPTDEPGLTPLAATHRQQVASAFIAMMQRFNLL